MPTLDEADKKARMERAWETGLFRYSLVRELAEPGLTTLEWGRRARELAGRAHDGPGGQPVMVSRGTLDRWRRVYEAGGFDALVPSPRQPSPRTPPEVLALAEALKREKPGRTAAQVQRILRLTAGWAPLDPAAAVRAPRVAWPAVDQHRTHRSTSSSSRDAHPGGRADERLIMCKWH